MSCSLAGLVFEKTGGNPFFAIQFLMVLAADELLFFDADIRKWTWEPERIRAKGFTENVVDLMAAKLGRFLPATRVAIGHLACLGNVAEVDKLTLASGRTEEEIRTDLRDAVLAGLLFLNENKYTFLHDRVQEAAYALIPPAERAVVHLRIGRALALRLGAAQVDENVFEIVSQFNRSGTLIDSPAEREQVAELNLKAARRAKAATAYASALMYLAAGRGLQLVDCWEHQYRLTFELELHRAECEFLTGATAAAEERLFVLSERAEGLVDRAAVTRSRMALFTTLGRADRAVDVALEYLRRIGFEWSHFPDEQDIQQEHARIWQLLGDRAIEELADLSLIANADWRATLDVLVELVPTAMVASESKLVDLALLRMTNLSLEHGLCDGSCYAFASLNIVLGFRFDDYQTALRFGQVGCDLVEKRGLDRFKTRVFANFGMFVVPWTQSMQEGRAMIRRGFDAAQASGDVTYAIYCSNSLIAHLLISGKPLDEVHREAELGMNFARSAGFGLFMKCTVGELRLIQELRGHTDDDVFLDSATGEGSSFEESLETAGPAMGFAAAICWVRKLQRCFFGGDYVAGVDAALKASCILQIAPSILHVIDYHFYAALVRAAVFESASDTERTLHSEALSVHHRQMEIWARNCPENFRNRAALIEAEIARIHGRDLEAQNLYEEAIRSARDNGFIQNEALAYEVAARFYAARGLDLISETYLRKAHSAFLQWGAVGKARQMERRHPGLRPTQRAAHENETSVGHLDIASIVKISHVVSGEIVLDRLVEKLMVIAVEHAGARRGLLVFFSDAIPRMAAEATSTSDGVKVTLLGTDVTSDALPESVLYYVMRTRKGVLLDDAAVENLYSGDQYLLRKRPRSVLCLPILKRATLIGVLYLENDLAPYVFTEERVAVLDLLASQAAISLENARLYTELKQENADRKRVEYEMRRTETLFAQAQRLSRTSTLCWKASTGEITWSEESYRLMECSPSVTPTVELIMSRCHPDDLSFLQDTIAHAARYGTNLDFKHRLLMPSGTIKHVHVMAQNIGFDAAEFEFVGAVIDITEQVEAKSSLEVAFGDIKKSEDQLRTIIDAIPALAWSAHANGSGEFFSKRWLDYTGLLIEEARGEGWAAAIHPDDIGMLYERWARIIASKKPGELEARMKRFDGEYRWFLLRGSPLIDELGNVAKWYGTNTDIEDLKRAEVDLRRSKVYLEHTQRLTHTGSVGMRVSDGKLFWSDETARIYGYDPAVAPTIEMMLRRIHPDDVALLTNVFSPASQRGASFEFQHRLVMPDRSIKHVRHFAHSVKDEAGCEEVLGAVTDITEQYHAKAALETALSKVRDSEVQLRTTIDTIPALAWSAPADGQGDFFSKRWLDYTGLSLEQAQGTGWAVAIHPDDLENLAATWTKIRASKKEGGLEARLRRFDGEFRWFLFRAAPLFDSRGNDVVWYGTNTDIEDLKQAEAELRQREADLRKTQAELAHVMRVTTMGELAASIAHEVNQPIAGVVLNGNACLRWLAKLQDDSVNLAEAREALQRIIRDGSRAGEVIARIRALFKKTEMAKEPLEVDEVIREVIVLTRSEMDKRGVALQLDFAPDLPRALGDRVQLQQVLINLILNGIESMSTVEGRLRKLIIGTRRYEETEVLLTVRDCGIGIDPANIDQLFAAFHTTKPRGLGMGLSISRSIVESHHGRLWATANGGFGATFQFTLPAHDAAAEL